jgi:hypothetical protein
MVIGVTEFQKATSGQPTKNDEKDYYLMNQLVILFKKQWKNLQIMN